MTDSASHGPPRRSLPLIDKDNQSFWTSGERGELRIMRCQSCGTYTHPPSPFCGTCESREMLPARVSGKARVATFTVNHKRWVPGLAVPYVVALVEIEEQTDVRLVTNIVDCDPNDVTVGMAVEVLFEQHEDLWVPMFRPVSE